jgi:hypothetical protein
MVSNFKYSVMDNRKDNTKGLNNAIVVLLILFFAIILREAIFGTLSSTWVTLMGVGIIGVSLSAMLLPGQNCGDIPNDP